MHPNVFVWKQVGWKMKKLSFIVTFSFYTNRSMKTIEYKHRNWKSISLIILINISEIVLTKFWSLLQMYHLKKRPSENRKRPVTRKITRLTSCSAPSTKVGGGGPNYEGSDLVLLWTSEEKMTFNSDFRPLEMVRIKIVLILCEPIKR